jgi:hypothetical protein
MHTDSDVVSLAYVPTHIQVIGLLVIFRHKARGKLELELKGYNLDVTINLDHFIR